MKLSDKQKLFSRDVVDLLQHILDKGYSFTFGDCYRPPELAQIYADKGIGIKNSLHCKRLAIDINLFDSTGKYLDLTKHHEQFGEYWESLDVMNVWGGRFVSKVGKPKPDGNHYQRCEK